MKMVIAIIRDERTKETRAALEAAGMKGITFLYVTGRGRQKGSVSSRELRESLRGMRLHIGPAPGKDLPVNGETSGQAAELPPDAVFALGFLPKRMLILVVADDEVSRIVQEVVDTNQTGRHSDGRIFICPMVSAIRVRTGEQGDRALL